MADYYLRLLREVFPDLEPQPVKLSISDDMTRRSEALLPPGDLPTVGIGFGASYGSAKMWPPERFAELADRLSDSARVVLLGAEPDKAVERDVLERSRSSPVSLVGKTDLPTLVATLKRLSLYITNDTGPMHLAAAAGTPVIGLFGPTSPEETGPTGENATVIYHGAECAPCFKRACPVGHECMTAITVDEVAQAALESLRPES